MANYSRQNAALHDELTKGPTLTQRVYDALRQEIMAGTLQPGERLVRRAMAKRLGVSPMPVTEALYMLELDGLVENKPLYGCRVRPLTLEDLLNDQVLREAAECQAARICSENASDCDIAQLMTAARRLDEKLTSDDPRSPACSEMHLQFHSQIATAAGFPCLADEIKRVYDRSRMRLNWLASRRFRPVPQRQHQELVQAIQTRDADVAANAMRQHIRYYAEDDRNALGELLRKRA